MPGKFLKPEEVQKLLGLGKSSWRPPEIVSLQEEIEGEKRALTLSASVTGVIDEKRAMQVVAMMLELDALYCKWAKGEIG